MAQFNSLETGNEKLIQVGRRKGLTLVELTVVIVIIGVLAAFAIPRMMRGIERSKAAEAFHYGISIQAAQQRYQALHGTYADKFYLFDVDGPPPEYFWLPEILPGSTGSFEDSWSVTFYRSGASGGYGNYTVTFTDQGYDPVNSTIENFPEISPLGD